MAACEARMAFSKSSLPHSRLCRIVTAAATASETPPMVYANHLRTCFDGFACLSNASCDASRTFNHSSSTLFNACHSVSFTRGNGNGFPSTTSGCRNRCATAASAC